jgi:hypothetical protein
MHRKVSWVPEPGSARRAWIQSKDPSEKSIFFAMRGFLRFQQTLSTVPFYHGAASGIQKQRATLDRESPAHCSFQFEGGFPT